MIASREKIVVCACCGNETIQTEPGETGMREPPDFDTRPGEPARSTILSWVSRCGNCGYCSADLSHIHEGGSSVVHSLAYRYMLGDVHLYAKACEFLCYSSVLEHTQQHADAGWSALHAAWICDDMLDKAGAIDCRRKAISLWRKGKAIGQSFGDDLASECGLAADVYRRAGEFEQAAVALSEGLDVEDLDPVMSALLRKQKSFIERRDTNRHRLDELQ